MKRIFKTLGFVFGAAITLGAIIICAVLSKNLGEFFDRED
jgi:hypothetical protein